MANQMTHELAQNMIGRLNRAKADMDFVIADLQAVVDGEIHISDVNEAYAREAASTTLGVVDEICAAD